MGNHSAERTLLRFMMLMTEQETYKRYQTIMSAYCGEVRLSSPRVVRMLESIVNANRQYGEGNVLIEPPNGLLILYDSVADRFHAFEV